MKRVFALIFLSILCNTRGKAQQIFMRKIQHPNGIQAHDIYSVFEDSKHYLWFTTDGGIWRFDGKNYKNFTTENGLPDNVVFLFDEDSKGRSWFTTYSNKLAYIEKDSVYTLPCNDILSQLKKREISASIYVDRNGIVYVTYFRSDDYVKITPPYKKENISLIKLKKGFEFFSLEIEKGGLISGSVNNPFASHRRKMGFVKNDTVISEITDTTIYSRGHRVSCYKQNDKSYLVSADNFLCEYKDGIAKNVVSLKYSILSALKDTYNNYWVSTIDGGIFLYKNTDKEFKHPEIYLKGKSVGRITQDHEGAYWITTLNDGVYYIPHIDVLLMSELNGLSNNIAYVYSDTITNITFCTDVKGNLAILRNKEIINTIDCNIKSDQTNIIKNIIAIDQDNYLFLGRNSFTFNINTSKITYIKFLEGINTIGIYSGGNIWISQQTHLAQLDGKTLKIEDERDFEAKINCVYVLNDSIIWLGTERGLVQYDYIHKKIKPTPEYIERKSIVSIFNLQAGKNLLIYKSDGISVVDNSLKPIKKLLLDVNGYSIKHVTKDKFNTIWISTNKGILRVDSKLNITNINEHYGLPSNLINAISTDENYVYIACDKGLTIFPLQKQFLNKTPPDIYLNHILINNSKVSFDTSFTLPYYQNFIKIFFTTISYRVNNDIICKYKMEGIDSDWKTTKNNEIEYTTLPPGDYLLTIYAINNDKILSSQKINLTFKIAPPIWKTPWFVILVITLLLLLILIIFRWRISLVRKRSKEKSDIQEQLGQMEMQALRSQMNPHFIFNAINSIQHYILANEPLLANKYLVKFSKLVRNVLEQSKQELISLEEEIETIRFYIEIESLRFEDSFNYTLNLSDSIDPRKIKIPSLTLQPYVENAIWHGLLLKKGEKKLIININDKNGSLIIEIDDNGIGRKAASAFKNDETKKKSLGMEITQNRLNLLSKSLGVSLEVKIIDKISEQNEPMGTKVIIKTPLLF
jgi:ligand-binding sensor domain-containing protein